MKKFLSILITVLMLMQMFTFAVSSEEASMYACWTGKGPGEIEFTTISGVKEYSIRLYRNEKLVVDTSHNIGDYDITSVKLCFLDEITQNGSGTYRAEVSYIDGMCVTTDDYYYKKPSYTLPKTDWLEFNQEKNYVVWNAVEGASIYDLAFCFSTDGGQSFWTACSYILSAEEDGTFFDFWGNPEDELKWIEESFQQEMINCGATAEEFIRAIQVVAYPADLNDANPSYSDYITFDGITIPDSGDDNVSDGSNQTMEIVDCQYEYYQGQEFYADLRLVYVSDDGTETYTIISSKECEIEGFDSYTPGEQIVTIWYGNLSTTVKVCVYEEEPVEPSYTVTFKNVKTKYEYSEEFYAEAWITDANGEYYQAEGWWVEGYDPCMSGWQTVTLWYGDYCEYYKVYVAEKENTDTTGYIKIVDYQREYYPGMEFYADLLVWEETDDGSMISYSVNISDCIVEGFDSYMPGEQHVTIWYNNYSVECGVTVYPEEPEPVYTVDFENVKTEYEYGEEFYVEVYETTADGQEFRVYDYKVEGFDPYMPGWQVVTVTYEGYSEVFKALVNEEATDIISGTCGENLIWTLDTEGILTISGTGDMYNYDGTNNMPWFDKRDTINSIIIENGVTSIGDFAFRSCKNLTRVSMADTVTEIRKYAFYGCAGLPEIIINDNVLSIGAFAFWECENLSYVSYSENLTSIGECAFGRCNSLISIDIHNGVTSIGATAFRYCKNLENINVDDGNKYYCSIDGNLFNKDKTNLIQYAIGKRDEAYEIPEGVTVIGEAAFDICENLTSINIPSTVTLVDEFAFRGCSNLTDVYYDGTEAQWYAITVNEYNDELVNATIHFNETPETSWWEYDAANLELIIKGEMGSYGYDLNAGTTEAPWADLAQEVETISIWDGVTSITDGVFINFANLKEVNLGGTVNKIGMSVFEYCEALEYIAIPDSVVNIGTRAFANCGLRTIDFGKGIRVIGSTAFQNCKFEIVHLPESLTAIRTGTFAVCTYLKEIHIPAAVMKIESGAFNGCTALTDVYFGGTEEQWNSFDIANGSGSVLNVTIHYNDEGNTTEYVTFENVKTEYEYGEEFYAEVWVTDTAGNRCQAEDYGLDGFDAYVSGCQTVTLSYEGYAETFEVYVKEKEIDEPYIVSVDFELLKDTYYQGEELKIYVYENMSDGTCNRVYDYEIVNFDSTKIGTQMVTINYKGFGEQFVITVKSIPTPTHGGGSGGGGSVTNAPVVSVSEEKCRVGNTVEVTVNLSNNTGFTNLGIEIDYDRTLILVDVIPHAAIGATVTTAQTLDAYPYNISFDATSNIDYNGELVTLVFEVPTDAAPADYFIGVDFYKGRNGDYIDGISVNYNENDESLGLCYEHGFVTVYNYIPGDINGDGVVTNKDGTALLRYLAGWELEQIDTNALDTDGDGTVTNKDGTRLLRYLAGWDVEVY